MEDGQRVNKAVGRREAPAVDQGQGVRRQIFMRQHGALRAAGRAGRVEDGREIVGRARDRLEVGGRCRDPLGERSVTRYAEAHDSGETEFLREPANVMERVLLAYGQRRLRIAQKIFKLGKRIGGVQRQQRGPRAEACERKDDHVGGLLVPAPRPCRRL